MIAIVAAVAAKDRRALLAAVTAELQLRRRKGEPLRILSDLVDIGVPYTEAADLEQESRAVVWSRS